MQDFLVEPAPTPSWSPASRPPGRTKVLQQELVEQAHRLEALLFEDPLTGLSNRRFILTQLDGLVSGARRHERPLAVAMIDIDHFKAINDSHGHAAGDAGARRASPPRCARRLRAEDQLGRLGGEEFLALLPDADARGAPRSPPRSCAPRSRPARVAHEGHELRVTVSIGWAAWDGEARRRAAAPRRRALYEAKDRAAIASMRRAC